MVGIKARYVSTIRGSYTAQSATGIEQSHLVQEITHKDNGQSPFSANLDVYPNPLLSGKSGSVVGDGSISLTDVSDSQSNYICSGSQVEETFLISAQGDSPPSVGEFVFTGKYFIEFEVQYTFDTTSLSVIQEVQRDWVI